MKKENPFINLLVNIIIPVYILIKLSADDKLGPLLALIIAVSLPIIYGLISYFRTKKINVFSIIGLVSVFLTGVIGGFELNKNLLIIKESSVPLIIGLIILFSANKNWAVVPKFFDQIIDMQSLESAYKDKKHYNEYCYLLKVLNYIFSGAFFLSAVLNFLLAYLIIDAEPGSVLYTQQIGRMTAISFPVIGSAFLITVFISIYLLSYSVKKYTGLKLEDLLRDGV